MKFVRCALYLYPNMSLAWTNLSCFQSIIHSPCILSGYVHGRVKYHKLYITGKSMNSSFKINKNKIQKDTRPTRHFEDTVSNGKKIGLTGRGLTSYKIFPSATSDKNVKPPSSVKCVVSCIYTNK